jgi:hypothetical protein
MMAARLCPVAQTGKGRVNLTRLGSGQPLLYHYTDSADVDSTELSYAELRALVQVSTAYAELRALVQVSTS